MKIITTFQKASFFRGDAVTNSDTTRNIVIRLLRFYVVVCYSRISRDSYDLWLEEGCIWPDVSVAMVSTCLIILKRIVFGS